jgi:hypothetical protein
MGRLRNVVEGEKRKFNDLNFVRLGRALISFSGTFLRVILFRCYEGEGFFNLIRL